MTTIHFGIGFNRPTGTNSFLYINESGEASNLRDLRFLVLAKGKDDPLYFSYRDYPLSMHEFSEVISDEGCLTGDTFLVEVYRGEGRGEIIKKIKVDAFLDAPSHAVGSIHVERPYYFDV